MTTHIITVLFVCFFAAFCGGCSSPKLTEGYGSCYEVRPLCQYPTHPLCVCNANNYCQWICAR